MKVGYICDHCPPYDREILTEEEVLEHEQECAWNPSNRHCLTCRLLGNVPYQAVDSMGHAFMNIGRGCTAKHKPVNTRMIFNCEFYEEEK